MAAARNHMEERAIRFINQASNDNLTIKLRELNLSTLGNKTALKSRLFEVLPQLSDEVLQQTFGDVPEDEESEDSAEENQGNENNDEINLDNELQRLKSEINKKRRIIELKRELAELNLNFEEVNPRQTTCFSFKDVEESLNRFSGDDHYTIKKWIQHFEEAAENFGWNSKSKLIYGKRLMIGTAKLFLKTVSCSTWNELKSHLLNEFDHKVSNAEIHEKLRLRKKKYNETYQQYILNMLEISSLGEIDESDVIQYIINGVPENNTNKLILYNARNINELKEYFKKYEKIKIDLNQQKHVNQLKEEKKFLSKI